MELVGFGGSRGLDRIFAGFLGVGGRKLLTCYLVMLLEFVKQERG